MLTSPQQYWGPPPASKELLRIYQTPEEYIGHSMEDLPTPALVLRKEIMKENCASWLAAVRENVVSYRADLKVLKVCSPSGLCRSSVSYVGKGWWLRCQTDNSHDADDARRRRA